MYRQANFHLNRALVKRLRRVFPRKYRLHEDLVKHNVVAILESFAWTVLPTWPSIYYCDGPDPER